MKERYRYLPGGPINPRGPTGPGKPRNREECERRTDVVQVLPGGPSGPRGPGKPWTEIDKFSDLSIFEKELIFLPFYLFILPPHFSSAKQPRLFFACLPTDTDAQ